MPNVEIDVLSSEDIAHLEGFIQNNLNQEDALTFYELCGWFAGVIVGPEILLPHMLWDMVLGDEPTFESTEQQDKIHTDLRLLYNGIAKAIQNQDELPVAYFPAHSSYAEQGYDYNAVAQWCSAFYEAVVITEDWLSVEAFLVCMFPISAMMTEDNSAFLENVMESEETSLDEVRYKVTSDIMTSVTNLFHVVLGYKFNFPESNSIDFAEYEVLDENETTLH